MSISYETVQNVNDGTVIFDGPWGGNCSSSTFTAVYSPSVPASQTRTYEPVTVTSSRTPSDSENFSLIKKSGAIKMTPHHASTRTEGNFPIVIKGMSSSLGWPHCTDLSWIGSQIAAISTWDEYYILDTFPYSVYGENDQSYEMARAKNAAMARCVTSTVNKLDALTEAAEAPETIRYILSTLRAVASPTKTYKDIVKRIKKRGGSQELLADAWLQYRYAIMPIILTIQNSMEMLENRGYLYDSQRGFDVVTFEPSSYTAPSSGRWVTYDTSGEAVFRATSKTRYSSSEGKIWSKTSINPMLTAWELIPLSFVADWFINIGDVLLSNTASMTSNHHTSVYCVSTKINRTETWTYHQNENHFNKRDYSFGSVVVNESLQSSGLTRRVVTDSYDRSLFKPSDVGLYVDWNLSNLQLADALALTIRPVTKLLRVVFS